MSQLSNKIFYAQLGFSLVGVGLSAVMIILNSNNSTVFLPILTSILFSWVPSPNSTPDLTPHMDKLNTILDKVQVLNPALPITNPPTTPKPVTQQSEDHTAYVPVNSP